MKNSFGSLIHKWSTHLRTASLFIVFCLALIAAPVGFPTESAITPNRVALDHSDTLPIAKFHFDGHMRNEGSGKGTCSLNRREFRSNYYGTHALYLDGIYGEIKDDAVCMTPDLNYSAWTAVIRFNAEDFEPVPVPGCPYPRYKNTILVGGLSARWFALSRSPSGNLMITFNNQEFKRELPVPIYAGQWTVIAAGFDLAARKVVVYVNGFEAGKIDLPEDFKLKIIGFSAEQSDKRWYFTNYSNGTVFHGLVSDLVIYDRLLSTEDFGAIPLKP